MVGALPATPHRDEGVTEAMFERLEETSLALWVGESLWGYPLMLSLHVVGLAVVVGLFAMRDLRLLGCFAGVAHGSLAGLVKLGWTGFIVNAASGVALFSSQATTFIESTPFLLKIGSIFLAAVLAAIIQNRSAAFAAAWDSGETAPTAPVRAIAAASLTLWIGAIVSGRLIAYL